MLAVGRIGIFREFQMSKWIQAALFALVAAVVAACGGGGGDAGTSTSTGTGTVNVSLTDSPSLDYESVFVTVEKVRIHRSSTAEDSSTGWTDIVLNPAKRVDLLDLQNGVLAELGQTALPAGRYEQLRLVLAEGRLPDGREANAVVLRGTTEEIPLKTPSGQQSGIKLVHGFEVGAGQLVDLVLDFDAARSVVKAGNSGNWNLKPVITVIPVAVSGQVAGSIDSGSALAGATASLQTYDAAADRVTVVRATTVQSDGRYLLSPVPAGSYNLVVVANQRASAIVTNVAVAAGSVVQVPAIALTGSEMATISGSVTPVVSGTAVRALQRVVNSPALEVEIAFANADSAGGYALPVPKAGAVRAPFGTSLNFVAADNAGKYDVEATSGVSVKTTSNVDAGTGDKTVDFTF